MLRYEELKEMFDKSGHSVIVTDLPLGKSATVIYANELAMSMTGARIGARIETLSEPWAGAFVKSSIAFGDDMGLCIFSEACRALLEEHANYKAKMEDALAEATMANKAKTKFLSEISHDIRTPMNAIMGMADIALNHTDDIYRMSDCLRKIQTASTHLMGLLNEVLDMSRSENGKLSLVNEPLQIADLVHSVLIVIKPQAVKKNIHLHYELNEIACENIVGDFTRLQQVFVNILSNAVKYTDADGDVWMRLAITSSGDDEYIMNVEIEDNGIGMSPEFIRHIFEPFEREREAMISKIEGSGLGMSITKRLVELMGGDIKVRSEKGKGSLFAITIPVVKSGKEPVDRKALSGRNILVLQGRDEKLDTLIGMLDGLGVNVDTATCGMETVEMINDADIMGKDYFAMMTADELADLELTLLLQEVCARKGSDFPVILLSENDWSELKYMLERAGVTDFVPLPLFESKIMETLYAYTEEGIRKKKEAESDKRSYNDCRVLIVEDNEMNLEIAAELISAMGAKVETAVNGQEAVDKFAASDDFYYDIIFMDVQMPVMDGLTASRNIRNLKRKDAATVCIAAMTANDFVEDRQKAVEAGMNEYVTKPLYIEQVRDCLSRLIGG